MGTSQSTGVTEEHDRKDTIIGAQKEMDPGDWVHSQATEGSDGKDTAIEALEEMGPEDWEQSRRMERKQKKASNRTTEGAAKNVKTQGSRTKGRDSW